MTTLLPLPWPPAAEDGWTIDDLEDLPPTVRREVHNGKLVIKSPAPPWHQEIERRICNLLVAAGRFAFTRVGVRRTACDTRVAEVGVFWVDPTDLNVAWHAPYRPPCSRPSDSVATLPRSRPAAGGGA